MERNEKTFSKSGPAEEQSGKAGRVFEFGDDRSFQIELRKRVDQFFLDKGKSKTGGSSYVWHYKHSVVHHTYVNIALSNRNFPFLPRAPGASQVPGRSIRRV